MVQCIRTSSDVATYTSGANIKSKVTGLAIEALQLSLNGSFASSGAVGTPAHLAPWPLLGRLVVDNGGAAFINAEPKLLAALDLALGGSAPALNAPTTQNGTISAELTVDFARMFPGCGIDATKLDLFVKSTWRAAAYYGAATAPTSINATTQLVTSVATAEFVPQGGFIRPEITQVDLDLYPAASDKLLKVDIAQTCAVPHLLLSAEDANGGSGTDAFKAVDGLVRNVTVSIEEPNTMAQVVLEKTPWNVLRERTRRRMQMTGVDDALLAGMVLVPLLERQADGRMGPVIISANSTIKITCDLTSTVVAQYSSVTPASGDLLKVVLPKFLRLNTVAPNAATTFAEQSNARAGRPGRAYTRAA